MAIFISERSKATINILTIMYSSISLFHCMIMMLARLLFVLLSLHCTRQIECDFP